MVAVREYNALAARLEVLQADGARLGKSAFDADMVLLHGQLVAHIAAITVVAGLAPTHLANATLFTVINLLFFVFIVVQCAYCAIVCAEVD